MMKLMKTLVDGVNEFEKKTNILSGLATSALFATVLMMQFTDDHWSNILILPMSVTVVALIIWASIVANKAHNYKMAYLKEVMEHYKKR